MFNLNRAYFLFILALFLQVYGPNCMNQYVLSARKKILVEKFELKLEKFLR